MSKPIFRFAPSPTGYLHLGHAYAALFNQKVCRAHNGKMLLRMENIDATRCKTGYEKAMVEDLEWLGFEWQGEIHRQSEHFDYHSLILEKLQNKQLVYPAFLSRSQIKRQVEFFERDGEHWTRDPDGNPHYPGEERALDKAASLRLCADATNYALRLDTNKALGSLGTAGFDNLTWQEMQFGPHSNSKEMKTITGNCIQWGDVILGRKDIATSYHLACVIDDGTQQVTHVVRGRDIFHATSVHRLLQEILGIDPPVYCHHKLINDEKGRKLSKRDMASSIRAMRENGMTPSDIHEIIAITP